ELNAVSFGIGFQIMLGNSQNPLIEGNPKHPSGSDNPFDILITHVDVPGIEFPAFICVIVHLAVFQFDMPIQGRNLILCQIPFFLHGGRAIIHIKKLIISILDNFYPDYFGHF
ncbi:MAG TPA: hypothetical protein DCS64_05070, partial [Algoriphagus sp.]|nr:hypothetical protein [Algoriphagus sp.]